MGRGEETQQNVLYGWMWPQIRTAVGTIKRFWRQAKWMRKDINSTTALLMLEQMSICCLESPYNPTKLHENAA